MSSATNVLLTISDSIAIEILAENAILTGVGNELHFHKIGEEAKVLDIRLKNKVHGIIKGNGLNAEKLLVYGEKEFMVIDMINVFHFKQRFYGKLSDWISTGIFYKNDSGFVLLTAHSVLMEFIYNKETHSFTVGKRVSCEDKSTLYCGHLNGSSFNDLVVFGGNAFGELLIWQPKEAIPAAKEGFKKVPLLQRLTAHNGVIFSIEYCNSRNLLITTSDDRSVQFWNVMDAPNWTKALFKPIASGYGHTARVFQGKIFSHENTTFVLTVGEDSYFCLWRCDGALLFKQRHQFGAVIWSFAYDAKNQTVYTVGSTGNLLSYNLSAVLSKSEPQVQKSLTLNTADAMEYVAKVKFLTKNLLIGVTNRNGLKIYDFITDTWRPVMSAVDFKCTVLEVSEKFVAICGFKRAFVYEFDGEDLKLVYNAEISTSVIRSFHFLSSTESLLSDDAGHCVLLKFDRSLKLETKHIIDLPKCKERWLTAALFLAGRFLLTSNRQGNILLHAFDTKTNNFELKHVLKHPHGYLGATLLKIIESTDNCAYVQSAGHDNTLKLLKINFSEAAVSIQSQQHTPVGWIEASIKSSDQSQSYLGFNDNHFVVWSSDQDVSLQVACGGGHRCWHFYSYDSVENVTQKRMRLAFIKNKKILFYDYAMNNESNACQGLPLRNHWHTRPCNVLEVLENATGNSPIVISAGDDNLIKISTLKNFPNSAKSTLVQRAEIQTHISNIRALKVLCMSPTKYLIFSGGGRAQLCLTELDLVSYRVCEILNFTLKTLNNSTAASNKQAHSFDPETRIMSIDVLEQETGAENNKEMKHFSIYAACSDGYIRKFKAKYASQSSKCNEFQLEQEVFYGRCLLLIRLVGNGFLLTAATDGFVTFFDLNLAQTLLKLGLHASGVNALDINYNCETKLLRLLTGGDDQAVVFTKICFKNQAVPLVIDKLQLPQLHTAQVTAAKLSNNGLQAYTSGVDQKLVHFDLETRTIINECSSCVADVKGVAICPAKNICLLYGCGLQVFNTLR